MERLRQQQEAAAATLHAALCYLNRGGVCKEPLSPGMFAKTNLKGMQAALYLLHYRIRGPARTKKELLHIFPCSEPAQAREFKAAMQDWVRELGAAGLAQPDTVKYFVSAYQGNNVHRTVLMLLDLSSVALARELGSEGPQATLPGIEQVQPSHSARACPPPLHGAQQSVQGARREAQRRLDEVVAVMQRLKQLQAQGIRQLAAAQPAACSIGAQPLAAAVPPLFTASQASARRCEAVQDLLALGAPPLTAKPEAVSPSSWADLLATGKAAAVPARAAGLLPGPLTARRLSNPCQEASAFAAEGLAADADVLEVHRVLVQRGAAAASWLQTAMASTATAGPGISGVRSVLAEVAAYREALVLSVKQELAAAKVRAEQQGLSRSASRRCSLPQLLPLSDPPCNPVLEGMQAEQQAAAADGTDENNGAARDDSSLWAAKDAATVMALRRSMWRSAQAKPAGSGGIGSQPSSPAGDPPLAAAAAAAGEKAGKEVTTLPRCAAAASSSSSKAARLRPTPVEVGSPRLADMISQSLSALPLLSEGLDDMEATFGSPGPQPDWLPNERPALQQQCEQQQQRGSSQQQHQHVQEQHCSQEQHRQQQQHNQEQQRSCQQLLPSSPCMAESCASASVVADNLRGNATRGTCDVGDQQGSSRASAAAVAAAAAARRQQAAGSRPLSLAFSPMTSTAGGYLQKHQQRSEHQRRQQQASSTLRLPQQQQLSGSTPARAAAIAARPLAQAPVDVFSPKGSTRPAAAAGLPQHGSSSGDEATPGVKARAAAVSWREQEREREASAAAAAAAALAGTPAVSRRWSAGISTPTPPKRLSDSPVLLQPQRDGQAQQPSGHVSQSWASPAAQSQSGADSTPLSRPSSASLARQSSATLTPLVLQPVGALGNRQPVSPPTDLLASCLKGMPVSPFGSGAATPALLQLPDSPAAAAAAAATAQSPWATPAAPLLSPPGGSRRRSVVLRTTPSPLAAGVGGEDPVSPRAGTAARHHPYRLASSALTPASAGLLDGPRLLDTPTSHAMLFSAASPSPAAAPGPSQLSGMTYTPPRQLGSPTPAKPKTATKSRFGRAATAAGHDVPGDGSTPAGKPHAGGGILGSLSAMKARLAKIGPIGSR